MNSKFQFKFRVDTARTWKTLAAKNQVNTHREWCKKPNGHQKSLYMYNNCKHIQAISDTKTNEFHEVCLKFLQHFSEHIHTGVPIARICFWNGRLPKTEAGVCGDAAPSHWETLNALMAQNAVSYCIQKLVH